MLQFTITKDSHCDTSYDYFLFVLIFTVNTIDGTVVSEFFFKNLKLSVGCAQFLSTKRGGEQELHKGCIRGHSPFQNWEDRNKMEAHCG